MTDEMMNAILAEAGAAADAAGTQQLPEGRTITLHAARGGVPLTIGKVVSVAVRQGVVFSRDLKEVLYVVSLEDLFAASVVGQASPAGRKAGF